MGRKSSRREDLDLEWPCEKIPFPILWNPTNTVPPEPGKKVGS